ncbi:MAG: ABC transporter permease [Pseudomonadota bacterium]
MADIEVIASQKRFTPSYVLKDIFDGLGRVQLWSAFAWDEIQQRYRRSRLGIAWIVFSFLLFVGAIDFFFSGFSAEGGINFTAYVAINYAIFLFLLSAFTEGCDVFRVSTNWIKSAPLPHSIYVYKSLARSLFVFGINLAVAFGLLAWYGIWPTSLALLSIPAFFVLLLNAVWIQLVFGYVAARYRDLSHLVQSISRLLFFITPIIYVRDESMGMIALVADFNPFTHALEIFSAPILGSYPRIESWIIMLALTAIGYLLAVIVGGLSYRRLAYWL